MCYCTGPLRSAQQRCYDLSPVFSAFCFELIIDVQSSSVFIVHRGDVHYDLCMNSIVCDTLCVLCNTQQHSSVVCLFVCLFVFPSVLDSLSHANQPTLEINSETQGQADCMRRHLTPGSVSIWPVCKIGRLQLLHPLNTITNLPDYIKCGLPFTYS
jgi:hypothetical protein